MGGQLSPLLHSCPFRSRQERNERRKGKPPSLDDQMTSVSRGVNMGDVSQRLMHLKNN